MAVYSCPNQVRHNAHSFLMCKDLMGDVKSIQSKADALKAYCPHQKHCSCSSRAENTEQARLCYQTKQRQDAKAY